MIRVALRADVKLVEDVRRALEKLLINDDYFKCVEHGNGSCGYQHWVCLCDKAEITIVDDVIILFGERQVINFGLGLPDELRDAMVMFYETDDDDLLPSASYCWYETVESSLPKALRLVCDWTCIKAVNIPDVIILGKLVRALACFENVSLTIVGNYPWAEDAGYLKYSYENYVDLFVGRESCDQIEAFVESRRPPYADIITTIKRVASYK